MSGSGKFNNSAYKIPRRRQNTTSGTADTLEINPTAGTSSPLSKKPTPSKNASSKPQSSKPTSNSVNHSKPREQHHIQNPNNRQKTPNQPAELLNKQKPPKRKVSEHEPVAQKHHRPSNDDPMELLDRIWKEMDEDDNRRKKSDDQQQRDGSISPTSSPFFQASTPIPSSAPKLTRYELMNAQRDDTIFRSLLSKSGLMERIIGYKMQNNSRVDSYEMMRKPAKLDECKIVEFDDSIDYGVPPYFTEEPSTSALNSNPIRGQPVTPPGSPEHEQEDTGLSTDDWHSSPSRHSNADQQLQLQDASAQVTKQKDEKRHKKEYSSRAELLETFSKATNTPVEKLEELIGTELQNAIGRVAKSVLLNTLKDAIKNVGVSSSPKPTPLNRVFDSDVAVDSPILTGNNEMECSSTADSNASSNFLIPPPPAPPPVQEPLPSFNSPMPMNPQTNLQTNLQATPQTSINPNPIPAPFLRQEFAAPAQLITSVPPPRYSAPSKPFQLPDLSRPPPLIPNIQSQPAVPILQPQPTVSNIPPQQPISNLNLQVRPPLRNSPAFSNDLPRLPPQLGAHAFQPYLTTSPSLAVDHFSRPPPSRPFQPFPLMSLSVGPQPSQRPHFPASYQSEQPVYNPRIDPRIDHGHPAPNYPPPFRHPRRRP